MRLLVLVPAREGMTPEDLTVGGLRLLVDEINGTNKREHREIRDIIKRNDEQMREFIVCQIADLKRDLASTATIERASRDADLTERLKRVSRPYLWPIVVTAGIFHGQIGSWAIRVVQFLVSAR